MTSHHPFQVLSKLLCFFPSICLVDFPFPSRRPSTVAEPFQTRRFFFFLAFVVPFPFISFRPSFFSPLFSLFSFVFCFFFGTIRPFFWSSPFIIFNQTAISADNPPYGFRAPPSPRQSSRRCPCLYFCFYFPLFIFPARCGFSRGGFFSCLFSTWTPISSFISHSL